MVNTNATEQIDLLNLLAQALHPMAFAPIGDQLILLTAIIHAEVKEDGSAILSMTNGIDLSLSADEAAELAGVLTRGIERAHTNAARQAATELGLIKVPGMMH